MRMKEIERASSTYTSELSGTSNVYYMLSSLEEKVD